MTYNGFFISMKQRNESNIKPTNWHMLNVFLPHYKALKKRMRINLDQFGLLAKIEPFQLRTGWCEPRILNKFHYLTPLLHDIGDNLGYDDKTTDSMIKTLITKGLLEKSPCKKKIRVTLLFAMDYEEGEVNDIKPNTAQPSPVVKTTRQKKEKPVQVGFLGFGDVPFFKDLDSFKTELKVLFPNIPSSTGFKRYLEGFRDYKAYKTGTATLETWKQRVKKYIGDAIEKGILKDENGVNIDMNTTTNGANTEGALIENVTKWASKVFYPTLNETNYRGNISMFIEYGEKAAKKAILQEKTVKFLDEMKALKSDSDIKAYYKKRLIEQGLLNTEGVSANQLTVKFNE